MSPVRWPIVCRALVVAFFLSGGIAGQGVASCLGLKPILDLSVDMRLVASSTKPLGVSSRRKVAGDMQRIDLGLLETRLNTIGQGAQLANVQRLMSDASVYARMGALPDKDATMRRVYAVDQLLQRLCSRREIAQLSSVGSGAAGTGALAVLLDEGGASLKVTLLVILAVVVCGLLFAAGLLFNHIRGYFQNNKTCKIPAQLRGNDEVFAGTLTRMGLDGTRFQPENDTEAGRLTALMASPGFVAFDLVVGDRHWPVFVDGFQKYFSPLYFLENISRQDLETVLATSQTTPRYAPHIGHESNRKKWKEEIRQRKAFIRKTRHLRQGNA